MTISFPIPLVDFADQIDVSAGQFRLSDSRRTSISARGEVITTGGGFRRWEGSVTLTAAPNARAGAFDAMLNVLTETGASALIYDHRRPFPASDPLGLILGSAPVTILSVNTDLKNLALTGLPGGYFLTRGDYLSFTFLDAAGGTQWSLHQVVELMVESNSAGQTPQFEVRPHLPEDVTLVGVSVTLAKPCCKAVLRSSGVTYSQGGPGVVSAGQSFEFIQARR